MLSFERTTHFKKDYKRLLKQQKDIAELETVLNYLINEEPLPKEYWDHSLKNCRQYRFISKKGNVIRLEVIV